MLFIPLKFVAIGSSFAVIVFMTSTIVFGVQKSQIDGELKEAREKLDLLEKNFTEGVTTSTMAPTTTTPKPMNYRLPKNLKPSNYDLYLHPNIEEGIFSGRVNISINVVEPTDEIILHSNHLNIENVTVTSKQTTETPQYRLDTEREFLIINLSSQLEVGTSFNIEINFKGNMSNKIVGLYSSSYKKNDNSKKWIASSKFEPTYARQAFPCFDEPAMKARFKVTLVRPNEGDYRALSNMNIEREVPDGNYTQVHFNTSVPMSTYLSCFIVSDFAFKEAIVDTNGIGDNFTMQVFATTEQLKKVDFALEVGVKVIQFYIQYFGIEYPLPKLDMAAIPDFVSGAMEHWGLVTYRETALLYDEKVSSSANKQRIASVIAHEFAHMWFGNLVTMEWWNDLWLNEGFASYIENKGVSAVFPDWKMEDQFIISKLHSVMKLDATLASHPIVQTVANPDQITEIFDSITYSKGASIIRMLEDFISPENFQHAVTNYLNKYKYQNTVTNDFLMEIEKLGFDFDVREIMRTWTEQMGLPVVNVTKISKQKYKLNQKRFFSNGEDYNATYYDSPFGYKWSIPITYITNENSTVQRAWFYHHDEEITINLPNDVEWIKLNKDQVGYYHVNYDTETWKSLLEQLISNPTKFTVTDRACLLSDAFTLADAKQLNYDLAMNIISYIENEDDYVAWSVAASKLTSLKHILMFTDTFQNYITFAKSLITKAYRSVKWNPGEDHLKNHLHSIVLETACALELEECMTDVSSQFTDWLTAPENRPHPNFRSNIYYYGIMKSGSEKDWEKMWNLFVDEQDASEKLKLMYGLTGIQIPWILNRLIDLAWNENYVRGQDYFICLQFIAENRIGENLVWNYVRENWTKIVQRFGLNDRNLGNMIPSITSRFSTAIKLEEMEIFFAKYPEAGAGAAARKRALANVKNNIKWLQENKDVISEWLKSSNRVI